VHVVVFIYEVYTRMNGHQNIKPTTNLHSDGKETRFYHYIHDTSKVGKIYEILM
jgi:hypothetical protein